MRGDSPPYAVVLRELLKVSPSTRLVIVTKLRCRLSNDEWWRLLGLVWYSCNAIADARLKLTRELREANAEDRRLMMSGPSAAAWDALPPEFTVYRGCSAANRPGLSWSTSREVAEAYAVQAASQGAGMAPLVLTGTVLKPYCVLMLDRGEAEAVSWNVWRVRQGALTGL